MSTKEKQLPQNPLILRCHRLMEAFAKSDDERDFFLDHQEGFILYADLDKAEEELNKMEDEVEKNQERYCLIPKLTFYETKKIMEGFVNEKVYDIDTKEKLLEIIQTKEARENFLEFIYDHHIEMEKWQQYYQERSRIRIIEWLRQNHFEFVFEEDLDLPKNIVEALKLHLFETKVDKEIQSARKELFNKAKTYYSNEALNPRPKRGRPPKQAVKLEVEPQVTTDVYRSVPPAVRPFLFSPEFHQFTSMTFSTRFETEQQMISRRKSSSESDYDVSVESLNQKLSLLRNLSSRWLESDQSKKEAASSTAKKEEEEEFGEEPEDLNGFDEETDEEEIEESYEDEELTGIKPSRQSKKSVTKKTPENHEYKVLKGGKAKAKPTSKPTKSTPVAKKAKEKAKVVKKEPVPIKKAAPKKQAAIPSKKAPAKKPVASKKSVKKSPVKKDAISKGKKR